MERVEAAVSSPHPGEVAASTRLPLAGEMAGYARHLSKQIANRRRSEALQNYPSD